MLSIMHSFLIVLMWYKVNASDHTNEWAVHIEGGDAVAQQVASDHNFDIVSNIFHDTYLMRHRRLARRSTGPHIEHQDLLDQNPAVVWSEQQIVQRRVKRDIKSQNIHLFNDPEWPRMWHLNQVHDLDMKVQKAWDEGVTGKGVVVSILDDGLERDHPDIVNNYDPDASYDVNDHKKDPMPRYDYSDFNKHGTRCAGEVAAEGNNSICSVGIAYKSSIGGVRMLDGDITDATEAESLSFHPQHIDIYSASWGPDDDGRAVDGPGKLATRAFTEGISRGRQGKGSIFVWASGNGGRGDDNCNCDGYSNSMYTLSVSAATEKGKVPWYGEFCTSTMATTFSSGSHRDRKIITTDLHHGCTSEFTGTSASAPMAAAICALTLEANGALTWRDLQHIVQQTANPEGLHDKGWRKNGVGRSYSHYFGFGLMDAHAMVKLAKTWTNVPEQSMCEIHSEKVPLKVPKRGSITTMLEVKNCSGVNFIEHIQSKLYISSSMRGVLEISLISPSGTKSILLSKRYHDHSSKGFKYWPFMTVHMWGENPVGNWTLEVSQKDDYHTAEATIMGWSLAIYGTSTSPVSSSAQKENLAGNKPLNCVQPFLSLDKKCLHISSDSLAWKEAQTYCKSQNSQHAELAELKDFQSIFKNYDISGTWVGGQKTVGGLWQWNNSKGEILPHHWKYGHPHTARHPRDADLDIDNRCLLLDPNTSELMDQNCREEWPVLCQRY